MRASYIDLANRFWRENRREPFTAGQTALYFYLLSEANALRWEMPMAVPTAVACQLTAMGKSSLKRSRDGLIARGMIECVLGKFPRMVPLYTIADTMDGTMDGTIGGTIIKDIDIDKTNLSLSSQAAKEVENEAREIEGIKGTLLADADWLSEIGRRFPDVDIAEKLSEFFSMLRLRGDTSKTLADTRSHFVNWLNKTLSYHASKRTTPNPDRRATPAAAARTKDFNAPFVSTD